MTRLHCLQTLSLYLALLLHIATASAQSGDGGSADGFQNSNLGSAGNGADGSSNSSANLSKGAIIAISVVVAVVVFLAVTLTVLFYLAKKRQWEVRATIRRTTTRVVRAMTPRTPAKMSFGPLKSPKPTQDSAGVTETQHTFMSRNKKLNSSDNKHSDAEKGFLAPSERQLSPAQEDNTRGKQKQKHQRLPSTASAGSASSGSGEEKEGQQTQNKNKKLPKPKPSIAVPSSHFEMDSPKSPMWQRLLGRK